MNDIKELFEIMTAEKKERRANNTKNSTDAFFS